MKKPNEAVCKECGCTVFLATCRGDITIIINGDGNLIYTPKQTPSNIDNIMPEFCRECGTSIQGVTINAKNEAK